jgi:hypothetical protein
MRRLLLLVPLAAAAACGPFSSEDSIESRSKNTSDADLALARKVVGHLKDKCSDCHSINEEMVRGWGTSYQSLDACLAAAATDRARIECMSGGGDAVTPSRLGLFAASFRTDQVKGWYLGAYPDGGARHEDAAQVASMPMGETAPVFGAAELADIKRFVIDRNMARLADAFTTGGDACTEESTPALGEYITKIANHQISSWAAEAVNRAIPMHDVSGYPDMSGGASGVTLKKLRDLPYSTEWWIRASADGRYVGVSGRIIDLLAIEKGWVNPDIAVDAPYDPYFFADNDGFTFADASSTGGITACKQSILGGLSKIAGGKVTFTEAACARITGGVYQSIGAGLDATPFYFLTLGTHDNDNGGGNIPGAFGDGAHTTFIPMELDGTAYRPGTAVDKVIAKEGDIMLSPSGRVLASRSSNGNAQIGYSIRFVNATRVGSTYTIDLPKAASFCTKGGKPAFSFDERFVVFHSYAAQSADIVLVDLKDMSKRTLTSMPAGKRALYPHFRADGWIYFLIRDANTSKETLAATDAARRIP